jgi:hypothetical protein
MDGMASGVSIMNLDLDELELKMLTTVSTTQQPIRPIVSHSYSLISMIH